jgi:hypothetical protein
MPTTTNFGWTTPADTDLVKDGAAAIRTLAGNIDTSLVDLKGGTTGQFLSKNSNTDLDFVFATPAAGGMTLLETLTLSGASVTSSSIAGTYKNLYLVVKNLKPANDGDGCYIRLNSDSGANRYLTAAASASQTGNAFTGDWMNIAVGTDNTTSTGLSVATIYDYANTTTWKMMITDSLQNTAADPTQVNYRRYAGFYNQTGAITTLQFLPDSGNFTSGSILIYGVN